MVQIFFFYILKPETFAGPDEPYRIGTHGPKPQNSQTWRLEDADRLSQDIPATSPKTSNRHLTNPAKNAIIRARREPTVGRGTNGANTMTKQFETDMARAAKRPAIPMTPNRYASGIFHLVAAPHITMAPTGQGDWLVTDVDSEDVILFRGEWLDAIDYLAEWLAPSVIEPFDA